MTCTICTSTTSLQWFTLIVTDPDDITAGHLCSLDCLTTYVTRVHAQLLDQQF